MCQNTDNKNTSIITKETKKKNKYKYIFGISAFVCYMLVALFTYIMVSCDNVKLETIFNTLSYISCYTSLFFFIAFLVVTKDARKIKRMQREVDKVKRKEEEEKNRAQIALQQEALRIAKEKDNNPIAATLMFVEDKYGTSLSGGLALMAIGGIIGGTFGAAYGAHKASNTKTGTIATFSVKYESGRKGTETVDVNSERFQKLAKLTIN